MDALQVDLQRVERSIRMIRHDKVILDEDLAELYGVEVKRLNEQVRRNIDRFPADFMFQLTNQEFKDLKSQFATSSQWGGRRTPPYAFTEQGVAMLSSVLHSPQVRTDSINRSKNGRCPPVSEEKKLTPAEKRAATLKQRQELIDLLAPLRKPKSKRQLLDEAQQLIYAAWEASSRQRTVKLARQALVLSADCADAYLLLADLESSNYRERFEFLRQGVEAGRRALGKAFFREHVGDFWGFLESRPFMRVMAALASTLWETGQSDEALATWKEMLRLNPNDNQGVRYQLLAALLELRRDDEAVALEKGYEGDGATEWLYAVALLTFRQQGKSPASGEKLQVAFKQNPHVPPYLLGRKKIPKFIPDQIISGSEDEAIACAALLQTSWVKALGALDWLERETSQLAPTKPTAR